MNIFHKMKMSLGLNIFQYGKTILMRYFYEELWIDERIQVQV